METTWFHKMSEDFPLIHPSALISPEVQLGLGVRIGPFCVLEGNIRVGRGTVLETGSIVRGNVTLGENNHLSTKVMIGEVPQDRGYQTGIYSDVVIGNNNQFSEGVTIHRASKPNGSTQIGDRNTFLGNSHVAHDCFVGNDCLFDNQALVAGHCLIGNFVELGKNAAVHQFCRLGQFASLAANSIATMDIPPFVKQHEVNCIAGINVDGLRRHGISIDEIATIRQIFLMFYLGGHPISQGLIALTEKFPENELVEDFVRFVRLSRLGKGVTSVLDGGLANRLLEDIRTEVEGIEISSYENKSNSLCLLLEQQEIITAYLDKKIRSPI